MKYIDFDFIIQMVSDSLAFESVGSYPVSVIGGPKPYEKRSDFQNGHNDAMMKMSKNSILIDDKLRSYKSEDLEIILWFLKEDNILVFVNEDEVKLSINLSDTFHYSSADCECFEDTDIQLLGKLYGKYGFDGLVAWSAVKRKHKPNVKQSITKNFEKAYKELINEKTNCD